MDEFKTCPTCESPDICERGEGCGREMLTKIDALEKLANFGAAVLKCHMGGARPLLWNLAEKHGVIERIAGADGFNFAADILPLLPKD